MVWLALGWHRRWITDDGLIAARTVRQILAGRGPVFNPGERVEANTSTLWTWLLAAVSWVTQADVYTVIEWTGLVPAPLGLLFALLGARDVQRRIGADRPLVPLGAAVPGVYEVFRVGYYGLLVPNTALVKEASSSDPGQGLTYLGDFVSPYVLWLPVLLIAASVPVLTITGSQDPLNHRSLFYKDANGQMVTLPLRTSYGTIALSGDILGTLGAVVPLNGLAIDTHGLSYAVGSHTLTNGHRIGHEKTTGMFRIIADYTVPGSVPVPVAPNGPAGPAPAAAVRELCG